MKRITARAMEKTMHPKNQRIMANDPSFSAWGWVVLEPDGSIVDAGAIKTTPSDKKLRIRKGDDRVRRINEIAFQLVQVIENYDVVHILSELPHGSQSAVAAVMIGATAGIMQTIGTCFEIPVEWYSESDAKMSVAGKRAVGNKDLMVDIIHKLYPDVPLSGVKWKDQAVADSLAVYHVATQHSQILKFLRQ